MGSLAVLLGFDAADRLGGGPPDGAGVVAGQVDGDGVGGDVDGDDLAGVDTPEGDLLPGDHDDAGVAGDSLDGDRFGRRAGRRSPPYPAAAPAAPRPSRHARAEYAGSRENVTASGPERRALSGSGPSSVKGT